MSEENAPASTPESASSPAAPTETLEVELKNPPLAALLAWLWPGAGHLYQGRTAKGVLFMVCILTTYFFGLWMGQGHVVYASWRPEDRRLPYICQIGVGIPALPAMLQAKLKTEDQPSPLGNWMTPPRLHPYPAVGENGRMGPYMNELSHWYKDLGLFFELGTLFTMVAGLLNLLAIYDAFAGPVFINPDDEQEKKKKRHKGRAPPDDAKTEENAVAATN